MKNENTVEILLIEDNPHDADMTIRALREKKLLNNLVHIKDGAEALDFIFATGKYSRRKIQDTPRLILLDIHLPKISGLDVLRKIRSDERTAMIPVVIMTSSNLEKDLYKSYELGVNSFITKPVEFDKFSEAAAEIGLYWMLLNQAPNKL